MVEITYKNHQHCEGGFVWVESNITKPLPNHYPLQEPRSEAVWVVCQKPEEVRRLGGFSRARGGLGGFSEARRSLDSR